MPFRAIFNGAEVSAWNLDPAERDRIAELARTNPGSLKMRCCKQVGLTRLSPLGQFHFYHWRKPSNCNSKPESQEHIELKGAVARAVADAGWSAEVEADGAGWEADVLATWSWVKIAFEVQLAAQGQAETARREALYVSSGVMPWWLVNARNSGHGFGSDLRTAIDGDTLDAQIESVRTIVFDTLGRITRQIKIGLAVRAFLDKHTVVYELEKVGCIPSVFRLKVGEKEQAVVLGEIGSGAVSDIARLTSSAAQMLCGAPIQFVTKGTRQIRGLGATAFYLPRESAPLSVERLLSAALNGQLLWRGKNSRQRVEGAFVWYDDTCPFCDKSLVRVPYAIYAHLIQRTRPLPSIYPFDHLDDTFRKSTIKTLEKRLSRSVGEIVERFGRGEGEPMRQRCPDCNFMLTECFLTQADALNWPHIDVDFPVSAVDNRGGWIKPESDASGLRQRPSEETWESLLLARRRTAN